MVVKGEVSKRQSQASVDVISDVTAQDLNRPVLSNTNKAHDILFSVSKLAGPRCERRELDVYRMITLEAMGKRHKDAMQDGVLFI
jgi:hypothetical protein